MFSTGFSFRGLFWGAVLPDALGFEASASLSRATRCGHKTPGRGSPNAHGEQNPRS